MLSSTRTAAATAQAQTSPSPSSLPPTAPLKALRSCEQLLMLQLGPAAAGAAWDSCCPSCSRILPVCGTALWGRGLHLPPLWRHALWEAGLQPVAGEMRWCEWNEPCLLACTLCIDGAARAPVESILANRGEGWCGAAWCGVAKSRSWHVACMAPMHACMRPCMLCAARGSWKVGALPGSSSSGGQGQGQPRMKETVLKAARKGRWGLGHGCGG